MVINNNFDHDISKLEDDLHIGLEVIRESNFEEAASNWKEDGLYHIYFGDKGTMIFYGHDMAIDRGLSQNHESMSYAYSATAMAFYISYSNIADNEYREIMESEDGRTMSEGSPLPIEADNPTADGLTFALIDKIMEQNWHEIDFGAKCIVCRAGIYRPKNNTTPSHEQSNTNSQKKNVNPTITPTPILQEKKQEKSKAYKAKAVGTTPKKKWWEFWK